MNFTYFDLLIKFPYFKIQIYIIEHIELCMYLEL